MLYIRWKKSENGNIRLTSLEARQIINILSSEYGTGIEAQANTDHSDTEVEVATMSLPESKNRRRGLRTLLPIGVILMLAAVSGAVAGLYLKKPPPVSPPVVSGLEPSPEHLNFGEAWEDTQFVLVLPITNHRPQDVEIKKFHKSCNCSRIEPSSLTIPAGETCEVRLILDLTPRKAEEFGIAVRDFAVGISPEVAGEEDQGNKIWWMIRGRVRSALQCDPLFVDLGSVSELAQPFPTQRIHIKTFVPLRDIKAACPSLLFDVKAERRSEKEPDSFDLVLRPRGTLPKGEIRCTVALTAVLADGKALPEKKVQVVGRIVGDIEATSSFVMFGAYPVGAMAEETIGLRSLTGRKFAVTKVRCEGDGLSVKRLPGASSATFRIEQKIGVKGEQQGKVIFGVRPDGGKDDEVIVVVSWFGTEGGMQ